MKLPPQVGQLTLFVTEAPHSSVIRCRCSCGRVLDRPVTSLVRATIRNENSRCDACRGFGTLLPALPDGHARTLIALVAAHRCSLYPKTHQLARIIQRKPQVARTNAERLEARGLACRVGSSQQWRPTAAGIDAVSARLTKRAA